MNSAPTLKDLAKAAGVSTFTASCAIRGLSGLVAAETAARVVACARKIGYKPNISAQALSQKRSRARPETGGSGLTPIAWLELSTLQPRPEVDAEMRACAEGFGFDLRIVRTSQVELALPLSRELRWRGVRGLLLNTAGMPPEDPGRKPKSSFRWDWFSVVKITHGGRNYPFHTVCCNAFAETTMALQKASEAGYRRVVAVIGSSPSSIDDRMRLGSLLACQRIGQPSFEHIEVLSPEYWQLPPDFSSWVKDRGIELFLGFPGYWQYILEQQGWRLPRDLAFVGLSVSPDGEPRLSETTSTMASNVRMHLPEALGMIHQLIIRGEVGMPNIVYERVIQPRWNSGKTMPRSTHRGAR